MQVITRGYGKVEARIRCLMNSDLGAKEKKALSQQVFRELSDTLQVRVPPRGWDRRPRPELRGVGHGVFRAGAGEPLLGEQKTPKA